jgi:Transposase IS66 family
MKQWLEKHHTRVSPRAPIGKAIAYARKHWQLLTRYLDDGRVWKSITIAVNALLNRLSLGVRTGCFTIMCQGLRPAVFFSHWCKPVKNIMSMSSLISNTPSTTSCIARQLRILKTYCLSIVIKLNSISSAISLYYNFLINPISKQVVH